MILNTRYIYSVDRSDGAARYTIVRMYDDTCYLTQLSSHEHKHVTLAFRHDRVVDIGPSHEIQYEELADFLEKVNAT